MPRPGRLARGCARDARAAQAPRLYDRRTPAARNNHRCNANDRCDSYPAAVQRRLGARSPRTSRSLSVTGSSRRRVSRQPRMVPASPERPVRTLRRHACFCPGTSAASLTRCNVSHLNLPSRRLSGISHVTQGSTETGDWAAVPGASLATSSRKLAMWFMIGTDAGGGGSGLNDGSVGLGRAQGLRTRLPRLSHDCRRSCQPIRRTSGLYG
jgi:hypothetical protein